ncbi:MAG: hypothetical protein GXO80_09165 [Chlorobi bacterium]|nr:hypothetical protein [Chlorobiota bacterium]
MNQFYTFIFVLISLPLFSQKKVDLKYKFQNTDIYTVTTNITSQSMQEVAGSPQDVSTNQQIFYTLTITEIPSDVNYHLNVKFNKISSLVNQSGQKQFFSSDSSNNQVSKIFKHFLTKELNFQLSKKGKKIPLFTINKLFSDSSEESQKYIFSQSVEQKITGDLPVSIIFPDTSISPGNSWSVQDTLTSGIFNFYNKTYTLDSISEKNYFISEKSDFSSDKNKLIPMNRVFISYNIKGTAENKFVLDKLSCIIKEGLIKQFGTGSVNMLYTKNSEPAYTWDMTVNNIVKLKTSKQ